MIVRVNNVILFAFHSLNPPFSLLVHDAAAIETSSMAARRLRGCSGGGWRVLTLAMAAVATAIVAVLRLVLSAPLPITSLSDSSLSPVPGAVPNVSLALGLAPRPISSDPPLNFAFVTPVASPPPPVLVHLPSGDVNSGSAYSVVKVDSSDQKPRLVEPKVIVWLLDCLILDLQASQCFSGGNLITFCQFTCSGACSVIDKRSRAYLCEEGNRPSASCFRWSWALCAALSELVCLQEVIKLRFLCIQCDANL